MTNAFEQCEYEIVPEKDRLELKDKLQYAVECLTAARADFGPRGTGLRFGSVRLFPQETPDGWFRNRRDANAFLRKFRMVHTADARVATYRAQSIGHPAIRTHDDQESYIKWTSPCEVLVSGNLSFIDSRALGASGKVAETTRAEQPKIAKRATILAKSVTSR
jgi:hypothetical protein